MTNEKTNVTFQDGTTLEVEKGITIYELSKIYQEKMKSSIIGAEINNEVVSMRKRIIKNTKINFIDSTTSNGYKINRSGLEFVIEVSLFEQFNDEYKITFDHSIADGVHMTIHGKDNFTLTDAKKLKAKMDEIIGLDLKIQEINVEKKEAISYFNKVGAPEKAQNIHNMNNKIVSLYKLENCINYFYSEMPYSTGCLKKYDLIFLGNNKLVLLFLSPHTNHKVPEYIHYQHVIKCFEDGEKVIESLGVPYLADLNKKISDCQIEELINITELNYDNNIYELVNDIVKKKSRFVLFAGPSSSGKTTTTKKVALQLRSKGYETLVISVDDYFKDRNDCPKDENGNYDFESLEALDIKLLNKDLKNLISGEKVKMPVYNFTLGKKVYDNGYTQIGENGVILLEGLHCLNDKMTPDLDKKLKYKVYLSPFLPLNVDRHNYISTSDLRLMRRIVRDNRSRGCDVGETINYWSTVRTGEEKYIFPFINDIDRIVNTSLIYEIGVLKVFVEPLLYSVKATSPAYIEARRLIDSLTQFFPIPSDYVPLDSVLREFIGKSTFENYK